MILRKMVESPIYNRIRIGVGNSIFIILSKATLNFDNSSGLRFLTDLRIFKFHFLTYTTGTNGSIGSFDLGKFVETKPDLILTNGIAYRYLPWIGTVSRIPLDTDAEMFHLKSGEPTMVYPKCSP